MNHFSGDSLTIDVPVTDAAGQPLPLDGFDIRYNARPASYQAAEEVDLTLGAGITVSGSTARVDVPADEINALGAWIHSFTLIGGNIGTQTLWAEPLNVLPIGKL